MVGAGRRRRIWSSWLLEFRGKTPDHRGQGFGQVVAGGRVGDHVSFRPASQVDPAEALRRECSRARGRHGDLGLGSSDRIGGGQGVGGGSHRRSFLEGVAVIGDIDGQAIDVYRV